MDYEKGDKGEVYKLVTNQASSRAESYSFEKQIPTNASSCPSCGFSFDDAARRLGSKEPPVKQREKESRSSTSFDSIDNARFVAGTILAERYRIVGLLGKGGMGEVYRADDLQLGQPVALKFLSAKFFDGAGKVTQIKRELDWLELSKWK